MLCSTRKSHRMTFWLQVLSLLLWQCQLLVCQAAHRSASVLHVNTQQRSLRVSQDENDKGLEYKIPKFSIVLEPTPHRITDDMIASVLSPVLEETLFDSLGGVQTQSNRLLLAQVYVEEGEEGARRTLLNTTETNATEVLLTTKIIVKGGLVNFKRTPPLEKVPEVIEDGINFKLVNSLPKDSVFGAIEKATYVAIEKQPPTSDFIPDGEEVSNPPDLVSTVPPSTTPSPSPLSKSIFEDMEWIKLILAPIVIILGIGVLCLARKNWQDQQHREQLTKDTSFETQESEGLDEDDAKSTSEWTTATTETQNHQYLAKSQYLASEETFERNSRLAVKKDMLESEWSTYNPNARASNSTEFEAATASSTQSSGSRRSLV